MTPEQIEQERIAFEAWYIKYGNYTEQDKFLYLGRNPNTNMYTIPHIQDMWRGWLARAEQSSWISVEDRLPEQDANYLIFTPMGRILIARFYPGMNAWWWYSETMHPTHWQPLPQPPEGATA